VECDSKSDTDNNMGQWNNFGISQRYLSNVKGRNEIKELQKYSHIGHCTQTAGSANVKVQNVIHGRNNIARGTDCKYRTAATLCTVETWFVSGT
jgi:hypothetical protein